MSGGWWQDWGSVAKDIVLAVIALYGASLATMNYFTMKKKDQRQVKVTTSTLVPTSGITEGVAYLRLQATNVGQRSVTVSSLYLELEGGGAMHPTSMGTLPGVRDTQLPATLADGQSAFWVMPYEDVYGSLAESGRNGVVKATPVCQDSSGTSYRGEVITIDPSVNPRIS
jgi:hypothetical protein